jgi:hypothetical protein
LKKERFILAHGSKFSVNGHWNPLFFIPVARQKCHGRRVCESKAFYPFAARKLKIVKWLRARHTL